MIVYAVREFRRARWSQTAPHVIEQSATEFGLHKVLKKRRAARWHWHFKTGKRSGTLEVTLHRDAQRVVVSVHQNRVGEGEWAKKLAPQFAQTLAHKVQGRVEIPNAPDGR